MAGYCLIRYPFGTELTRGCTNCLVFLVGKLDRVGWREVDRSRTSYCEGLLS